MEHNILRRCIIDNKMDDKGLLVEVLAKELLKYLQDKYPKEIHIHHLSIMCSMQVRMVLIIEPVKTRSLTQQIIKLKL